jgi:hypothetical protein
MAGGGSDVSLVVRDPNIAAEMSAYLVDRLLAHPRVTVQCRRQVTRLDGTDFLEEVSITDRAIDVTRAHPCSGLFCARDPLHVQRRGTAGVLDRADRTRPERPADSEQRVDRGPLDTGIGSSRVHDGPVDAHRISDFLTPSKSAVVTRGERRTTPETSSDDP